ncbi:MAG: TatD family hydrolase [Deltaproteobacteria bacterium]|nr:TatD family hydrolase [Deltaproteobacteria bacterium]
MEKKGYLQNEEEPYLIDSHSHLEMPDFDEDRQEVIQRARKAGVRYFLTVGTHPSDWEAALRVARRYAEVYSALGIHPHYASGVGDEMFEQLKAALKNRKVVAVGEMGLDFYRDRSPRPVQIEVFRRQLRIALDMEIPAIIHDREAHKETLEILKYEGEGRLRGVIHCFSGDPAAAEACLSMGFYISVPGTITYSRNENLRRVIAGVPLEKILVETDCPYLTPEPLRGRQRRNEPANVVRVAETLALLHHCTVAEVARITSRNMRYLFGIGN